MSEEYPWDKVRADCWSQVHTIFIERGPQGELCQFYRAAPVDNARKLDDEQIRRLRDAVAQLTEERDTAREMLKNLVTDVEEAFGERYKAIVDEASGDISVNTAFKIALRDERAEARAALQGKAE